MTGPLDEGISGDSMRAVIDIGTNSVKLLVARIASQRVTPIEEANEQTRLGNGLYRSQLLLPEAIESTSAAVDRMVRRANEHGAQCIRIIATSAVREARNAPLLIQAIFASTGLLVEIISGDTEARLVFQGVRSQANLGPGPMLVLDAGGGSTEFILGHGENCLFRQSFPLGVVRMLEGFPHQDPPGLAARTTCLSETTQFLERTVRPVIEPFLLRTPPLFLVGTGGSAAILARIESQLVKFDRVQIEATRLSRARLGDHVSRLWGSTLSDRRAIPGIPPERADIIIMGAIIYEAVMKHFVLDELRVSTRGLRFAALLETAPCGSSESVDIPVGDAAPLRAGRS